MPRSKRLTPKANKLLPGFIDLHVHGAMGYEVMDASPSGFEEMARFYASHGVTSFLATTWTASVDSISRALELVEEMQGPIQGGATLLGVHLEGPYLHPARCGAQDVALSVEQNKKRHWSFWRAASFVCLPWHQNLMRTSGSSTNVFGAALPSLRRTQPRVTNKCRSLWLTASLR